MLKKLFIVFASCFIVLSSCVVVHAESSETTEVSESSFVPGTVPELPAEASNYERVFMLYSDENYSNTEHDVFWLVCCHANRIQLWADGGSPVNPDTGNVCWINCFFDGNSSQIALYKFTPLTSDSWESCSSSDINRCTYFNDTLNFFDNNEHRYLVYTNRDITWQNYTFFHSPSPIPSTTKFVPLHTVLWQKVGALTLKVLIPLLITLLSSVILYKVILRRLIR